MFKKAIKANGQSYFVRTMIVISKAHIVFLRSSKKNRIARSNEIPKRKKKHPSFHPSNVRTINEATSKHLRRRVWEREAKSSRFQTNIEISWVESWLGPSSTTNGSGKLGLETIHLVHFQNYGEQELLPPREISHGILEPSSSSSSSSCSRMDASRWFIERKFRFTLLSYPFNCSPFELSREDLVQSFWRKVTTRDKMICRVRSRDYYGWKMWGFISKHFGALERT